MRAGTTYDTPKFIPEKLTLAGMLVLIEVNDSSAAG